MSVAQLESQIWRECQRILENPKMKKKELLEWLTGQVEPREGEIALYCDGLGVHAVVPAHLDKRAPAPAAAE